MKRKILFPVTFRISFDGRKLIRYAFFLPVRRIPIDQINTVNYDSARKIMRVHCPGKNSMYVFPCKSFAGKDMDELWEILAWEHGIKTIKT